MELQTRSVSHNPTTTIRSADCLLILIFNFFEEFFVYSSNFSFEHSGGFGPVDLFRTLGNLLAVNLREFSKGCVIGLRKPRLNQGGSHGTSQG